MVPASSSSSLDSESVLTRRIERVQRALKAVRSTARIGTAVILLDGVCRFTGDTTSGGNTGQRMKLASSMSTDVRAGLRAWCAREGVEMIEADGRRQSVMEESDGTIGETGSVVPLSTECAAKRGPCQAQRSAHVAAWENAVMRRGSPTR